MANTDIFKYSTNERLGKMDVDLITVIPTVQTGTTDADGDLLFDALGGATGGGGMSGALAAVGGPATLAAAGVAALGAGVVKATKVFANFEIV